MASVPNMRLSPAARPALADQPGETGEGEPFAQLLSTTVAMPGESEAQPQEAAAPEEDRPATGQAETPIAQADAILSLVAAQAAPPAKAAPASGDTAAKTVVAGLPTATATGANPVASAPTADASLTPPAAPAPTAPISTGASAEHAVILDQASTASAPAPNAKEAMAAATIPSPASASIANPPQAPAGQAVPVSPTVASSVATAPGPHMPAAPNPAAAPAAATIAASPAPGAAAAPAPAAASASSLVAELAKTVVTPKASQVTGPAPRTVGLKSAHSSPVAASDPLVAAAEASAQPVATPHTGVRTASASHIGSKGESVANILTSQGSPPLAPPVPAASTHDPVAAPSPAEIPAAADLTAPEAVIERQLDLAADSEWLDQLARDIAEAGGSEGRMRFRLDPEHLGTLRVELTQGDRGTSVRLIVENEAARSILAEAQPKLAAEARAQGVRLAETHIDFAGGHAGDSRRHEAARRDPQLRTARETPTLAEPERPQRASSDRYA